MIKWQPLAGEPEWRTLGASEDVGWDGYIRAVRDALAGAWGSARQSYLTWKGVRESLGLPLIVPTSEAAFSGPAKGAMTPERQQQFLDAQEMVLLLTKFADDALAGKRRIAYDEDKGGLIFEALPEDVARVEIRNSSPVIIASSTGQPISASGTIGVAPIIWAGAAFAVAAAAVAGYFTVKAIVGSLENITQQLVEVTMAKQRHERIVTGKTTVEQEEALTASLAKAKTDVLKAEAVKIEADKGGDIASTAKTIAIVAAIIAALYFAAKILPEFTRGRTSS